MGNVLVSDNSQKKNRCLFKNSFPPDTGAPDNNLPLINGLDKEYLFATSSVLFFTSFSNNTQENPTSNLTLPVFLTDLLFVYLEKYSKYTVEISKTKQGGNITGL